jgi:hypothetical protein
MDVADSAEFLNILDRSNPAWASLTKMWTNQPMRRIHHSASSAGGKIWLVGGEKDDGSINGLSDNHVFDPITQSSSVLSSAGAPPDIYGHTSIVLPDGRLIIFGGLSPSLGILLPFDFIWALDTTQSDQSWGLLPVSSSTLPSPRRAFAAVILSDGKILIQGGADAVLQSVFSDGWILDTTKNPMVWTSVPVLSAELGPRYDHFAIVAGTQVLFGFGESSYSDILILD